MFDLDDYIEEGFDPDQFENEDSQNTISVEIPNPEDVTNKVYRPFFLQNTFNENVYKGARGSGKTKDIAQNLGYKSLEVSTTIALVRSVQKLVRNSNFKEMKLFFKDSGLESLLKANTKETLATKNGSEFIMIGTDDSEKLKGLAGCNYCWIEEADQISYVDYINIRNTILRGGEYFWHNNKKYAKQIFLSFNPTSEDCWIKKEFFDSNNLKDGQKVFYDKEKSVLIFQTNIHDNKWASEKEIKRYQDLKGKDELRYMVDYEGKWGVRTKGLIFEKGNHWFITNKTFFPIITGTESDSLLDAKKTIISNYVRRIGLDFGSGGKNDPVGCTEVIFSHSEGIVYIKELFVLSHRLKTKDIALNLIKQKITPNDRIYGDNANTVQIRDLADPKLIEQILLELEDDYNENEEHIIHIKKSGLLEEGFDIKPCAKKGKKIGSKAKQIEHMKMHYSIYIHEDSKNLIKEMNHYSYEMKGKDGKYTNEPQDGNDHCIDPSRNAIYTTIKYGAAA